MLNKFSLPVPILVLATSLMWTGSAESAVADWKSFDEKVAQADTIVLGEPVASESRRDPDGRWIRTWTTFRVSEVLKGRAGSGTITIVTPGGAVDGMRQESIGTPGFENGREHVLFLRQSEEGLSPLFLGQGVYDVTRDERNRALVRPGASNLILYDSQTGRVVPAEATKTLDRLRNDVRASLDREMERVARATAIESRPETEEDDFIRENALILVLLSIGLLIALITWMRRQ